MKSAFTALASTAALILAGNVARASIDMPDVFSPKDMLSAPRPQAPVVCPDGSRAISVVDRWDSKEDETTRSVYLISLDTTVAIDPVTLVSDKPGSASEFIWLSDDTVAYLNESELYSFSINSKTKLDEEIERHVLLEFPEGISPSGLQYQPDSGVLAFSGQVWQDESFETVARQNKEHEQRGDSGMVYDNLFVRHWDTWRVPGRVYTIGVTIIEKTANGFVPNQKYANLLKGSGLYSQADPIVSFSLSAHHLAFSVKSPHLDVAFHTREDVYLISLPDAPRAPAPTHLTPNAHGAISDVKFSPDGKKIAWLEMAIDGYEADRRVVVVHALSSKGAGKSERWTDEWDDSPSNVEWSPDSTSLFVISSRHGVNRPYHIAYPHHPRPLDAKGVNAIKPLTSTSLLVSKSSITSPSDAFILDMDKGLHRVTDWSARHIDGRLDGMKPEAFWFKGAENWDVMAWAIKPRGWSEKDADKGKVWPMAFLVHGGPQDAWEDSWSTRWNPAVFASQGYFIIAVNPTGSTGYGQEFCDRIKGDWGGNPLKDLLAGYNAALMRFPEIDADRTAMLGGSYGGYMANWIQGHNDLFRFKAIVCHDGIFNTIGTYYTSDELWFPLREFGHPTANRDVYEKWNPMNHVKEWKTPQLVIHGAKDYRLVDGEGLAAFVALQSQGVPSRYLYFPDENHWVLKPHNSMKWHFEVLRWINEWTGEKEVDGVQRLVIQA